MPRKPLSNDRRYGTSSWAARDISVFGSPEPDRARHENAVAAALAMQEAAKSVNASRRACGQVTCEPGIAIHCGQVLHRFIGSNELLAFTVIKRDS